MVRSETAGRPEASGGIFREHDGPFRSPERSGGTERCEVSGVNDAAELRAEQTADQVMDGGIFREADTRAPGGGDGIFREAGAPGAEGGTAEVPSADLSEPGSALPDGLRQSMEEAMGADFSNVRVHTGPGADRASERVAARAFAKGEDVYFRGGEYDPGSREGQHLIAHELAHVAHGDGGVHRVNPPAPSGSPAAGAGQPILSEAAREMVQDPAFDQFLKAVGDLRAAGGDLGDENDAAMRRAEQNISLGKEGAEVSLKEKRKALGINAADKKKSRAASGFNALGKSAGEVAGDIGAAASVGTVYAEGKELDTMAEGEEKDTAKKAADKLASDRKEGAASITGSIGSALAGIGGAMDAVEIGKRASAQQDQDAKAKQSMKTIGAHLERTILTGGQVRAGETPRASLLQAVCERVKQDKFNKDGQSMLTLIDEAMADELPVTGAGTAASTASPANTGRLTVTPALTPNQKQLLSTLRLLESSRASSKAKASELRKETVFSALDSVGSFFSSAGSLSTGIGTLVGSSLGGIVGAVLSLLGKIIGQVGAVRGRMAKETDPSEENDKKMEASKGIIRQMSALPEVDRTVWDHVKGAAGASPQTNAVTQEQMAAVDQYAGVFVSARAANLNISDILFAIERGSFGAVSAGQDQAAKNRESLDRMYANLSMS